MALSTEAIIAVVTLLVTGPSALVVVLKYIRRFEQLLPIDKGEKPMSS